MSSATNELPPRRDPRRGKPPKRRKPGFSAMQLAVMLTGGGVFLVLVVCGGLLYVVLGKVKDVNVYANQPEFTNPAGLFPIEEYPVPNMPELDSPIKTLPSGATVQMVDFASVENELAAGHKMVMRVYLPPGDHAPASIPCVLVAPAGTNLMVGCDMDADDYHDETLPYTQAGMAVIFYSLDGRCDLEHADESQLRAAYLRFRAAAAGVVNGRNALEFALARMPMVDPTRIYSAGHSSAANVSLLLAAHDSRISRCIAYCPAADVESELAEVINDGASSLVFPKLPEFLKQSNPKTHAARFKCPVFLFHARDDSNTPFRHTEKLSKAIVKAGGDTVFSPVDRGGHYQSMIDAGIPSAIKWLGGVAQK